MKVYLLCLIILLSSSVAQAGSYSLSAHGDNSTGVERSALSTPGYVYVTGNCAHCHEQHDGTTYCLFYNNYVSQTDAFCFKCHDATIAVSDRVITNYNYSRRAGAAPTTSPDDILEIFSSTSSHNLTNIQDFLSKQTWDYKGDYNPCCGCHNPHAAQGDPFHSTFSKSSGTRGWPVSLPSAHSNVYTWGLYGDETNERMYNDFGTNYQAPYRYYTTTPSSLEPQGNALNESTLAAQNTTNYVTFCQDCHSTLNDYGLTHSPIYWTTGDKDKHGAYDADGSIDIKAPYSSTVGKVLSCTDCHEPHGAPNVMLIRKEVNGGELSTITTIASSGCLSGTDNNKELGYLCQRCHEDDDGTNKWYNVHHEGDDRPYDRAKRQCKDCHGDGGTSFVPETYVLISDRIYKPIGEIKAGDKILSFDFDNNTTCESEVIEVLNHLVRETLEINGLKTTPEHPFSVGMDRWVQASKLKTGDTVLGLAEHRGGLEEIKLEKPVYSTHQEGVEVVNITVKGTQNFFVIGKENKFLVHNPPRAINCNCCHYHGASRNDCDYEPFSRHTF